MGKGGHSKTADLKNEKIEVDLYGKRIDVTKFQRAHPGGAKILRIFHHRDATEQFVMCGGPRLEEHSADPPASCPPCSATSLSVMPALPFVGQPLPLDLDCSARAELWFRWGILLPPAPLRTHVNAPRCPSQVPLAGRHQEDGAHGEEFSCNAGRERCLRHADGQGL